MRDSTWGLSRAFAAVFGVVYLLIGVLGFIPPLVTGSAPPDMQSASGNLLGIFPINAIHSIVHLVIGAALLYGATSRDAAVMVLRVIGVTYLVVGVLGFIAPNTFGLMPIGGNDIWLHLGTAAVLLIVSFLDTDERRREARTA